MEFPLGGSFFVDGRQETISARCGECFLSTSTWALFDSAIRAYLRLRKIKRLVNMSLAVMLIYTAIELSGLLPV